MNPVGLATLGPKPIEPQCCRLGQWLRKRLAATLLASLVVLLAVGLMLGVAFSLARGGGEADVVEEGLNMGDALDCWQGWGWCLQVALHLLE